MVDTEEQLQEYKICQVEFKTAQSQHAERAMTLDDFPPAYPPSSPTVLQGKYKFDEIDRAPLSFQQEKCVRSRVFHRGVSPRTVLCRINSGDFFGESAKAGGGAVEDGGGTSKNSNPTKRRISLAGGDLLVAVITTLWGAQVIRRVSTQLTQTASKTG